MSGNGRSPQPCPTQEHGGRPCSPLGDQAAAAVAHERSSARVEALTRPLPPPPRTLQPRQPCFVQFLGPGQLDSPRELLERRNTIVSFLATQRESSQGRQLPRKVLVYCGRETLHLLLKAQFHHQGILAGQVVGAGLPRTSKCWISFIQINTKSAQ